MNLTVNGLPRTLHDGASVAELLAAMDDDMVASARFSAFADDGFFVDETRESGDFSHELLRTWRVATTRESPPLAGRGAGGEGV